MTSVETPPEHVATPVAPDPPTRLCDGCQLPLDPTQKEAARHHGAACRQLSYRRRQDEARERASRAAVRQAQLDQIDRTIAMLVGLREEIARGA